ncbi:MAG: HD domain-containing protein [Pyrinomonadaceae bacterium]|nr:HD domain-containing protein [Pyrinomonadaceae bacterium]
MSRTPLSNSRFNRSTWLDTIRALTVVGHNLEPAIFAHFQPHAHATARLARHFAAYLFGDGKHRHWLDEIEVGAYMHDVGKYFITPEILLKPDLLDEEERKVMALHSVYGALAISKLPGVTDIIHSVALCHHEHWDGSGYPDGLSGPSIPLEARIVAVADVYISLRAKRPYKSTLSKDESFNTLQKMAGLELDPSLVEDFLREFERGAMFRRLT